MYDRVIVRTCRILALTALAAVLLLSVTSTGAEAQSRTLPPPAAQPTVDVELVLAVDVSLSMDLDEQRLQRDGYVAAFRHPDVIRAITSGGLGRIAVVFVEWAGAGIQSVVLDWRVIDSAAAAHRFADDLAAKPISRARMTSISGAIEFASMLFQSSGERGLRRVVDISGDGPNNSGKPVADARDELVRQGVIINGLPIMLKATSRSGFFDISALDRYYRDCVIGGPGAFVIPVKAVGEFPAAIRQKLLLEIAGLVPERPAGVIRTQATGRPAEAPKDGIDCMIGEKLWQRYLLDRFSE
ncbi:MAG: DUF1194 domain-containing protein [Hyphomicrobiaceae bacterium]